jgi:NadR type nicotinamide-nucleotide adenylyltransferase
MKKIVVIGPESTGKSTLCEALAKHYSGIWVKEYAREYLLQNGTDYTYDDLLTIAKGQIQLEDKAIKNPTLDNQDSKFFIDTDMYVMKTWCEYVFGNCHYSILKEIAQRNYDLYLLCNIDLPWVKDELREYPDFITRATLFNYYKDIVINSGVPWAMVSGTSFESRANCAIESINQRFNY